MTRPDRVIAVVVLLAMAVSVFHYVDNYSAYEAYPQSDTLPNPSAGLIAFAWFLFTAFAVLGLYLLRRGDSLRAGLCLGIYSGSGLVGIGHYLAGPTGAFPWWRHGHIAADIVLGAAVLGCAVYLIRRGRSEPSGAQPAGSA